MSADLEVHDPFKIPDHSEMAPEGESVLGGRPARVVYAYEMRVAGVDWETIADKLGYATPDTARTSVLNHVKKQYQPRDVDEIVELELMRLDRLQLLEWRKAQKGDGRAVQNILKIMERRASYLGLDKKPTETNTEQHNTAIFIGGSEAEYVEALVKAREIATGKRVIDQ